MDFFAQNKTAVATVMLVSELKAGRYFLFPDTLVNGYKDNLYLVAQELDIPPIYYQIPSISRQCQEKFAQVKEDLLFWGMELGIMSERCLLVLSYHSNFSKSRLLRQLTQRLHCPVRLLA